jgi:hypothetical protein
MSEGKRCPRRAVELPPRGGGRRTKRARARLLPGLERPLARAPPGRRPLARAAPDLMTRARHEKALEKNDASLENDASFVSSELVGPSSGKSFGFNRRDRRSPLIIAACARASPSYSS